MSEWTKAREEKAIGWAKDRIRQEFKRRYGFAPAKKDIIPLEASYRYDKELDMDWCDALGFHVGGKGYSWRAGYNLEMNEAYDMNN